MLDKEIEALGLLAYKRGLFYESKKDSLRQDIERLRNFLEAMAKDRELMQKQAKAEHILCRKKLVRTEKELQETQNRLRETENEAACLLESKHAEMERLQKERDDALAKVEILCAESCFLKGYGNHLEQKVCALVVKLHEYHQQLQRKTEEVIQTRGRAVDEWQWVRQSMTRFQDNLLEFQNTNTQSFVQDTIAPKNAKPNALLQHAPSSTEYGSASEDCLEIMNQFLTNRGSQHKSSSLADGRSDSERFSEIQWIPQRSLDHSQAQANYPNRQYNTPYDSEIIEDFVNVPLEGLERTLPHHSLGEDSIYDYSSTEE